MKKANQLYNEIMRNFQNEVILSDEQTEILSVLVNVLNFQRKYNVNGLYLIEIDESQRNDQYEPHVTYYFQNDNGINYNMSVYPHYQTMKENKIKITTNDLQLQSDNGMIYNLYAYGQNQGTMSKIITGGKGWRVKLNYVANEEEFKTKKEAEKWIHLQLGTR